MKFKPFKNRIVVAPDAAPDKIGEVWMSEQTKSRMYKPTMGTVIACGEVDEEWTQFIPGTRVVFHPDFQGTYIELEGQLFIIMSVGNIFGHIPTLAYDEKTTDVA